MSRWPALSAFLLCSFLAVPLSAAQFTEVGSAMNLPSAIGGAWGDYDNDGYPDLFTGGVWESHRCVLWHNDGDGTFTDVTVAMGLHTDAGSWEDWGAAWGDFNNDGRLDLIVTGGNHPVFLYRNDGDTFTDVGGPDAGFALYPTQRGVAWGDYDGDNWLDVYICYEESDVSRLYHNNGDGTFTEVTNEAGMEFTPAGLGIGASWGDYDGDGKLDLAVARMKQATGTANPPRLYHNNGNGTFNDLGASAGLANGSTNGVAWGDYNNDGFLDLYLGGNQNRQSFLYRNHGDGTFTDTYATAIGSTTANAVGVAWADYDNDGFLDLAQANCTLPAYNSTPSTMFLFHNSGGESFEERASSEGMTATRKYRTAVWADYDRDGKMDLFAAAYDPDYSCLYHNTGSAGNHLRVRVLTDSDGDATDSDITDDRDAIGARVDVNLDNDITFPVGRTLMRVIDGGSSFCGQNEPVAQFGVGSATTAAVRVWFPDGKRVIAKDQDVDQEIVVREPRFTDVPFDYWAHAHIDACYEAGIVGGYEDGYHPEEAVTRAQMAVFVSRALAGGDELVPTGPAEATFTDVPTDHWAFDYVEYAYANSIVGGYEDGYHPSDLVDRGQMAVFIARCMVTPHGDEGLASYTPPATATFPDVPTEYWSYLWIEYLYGQGIVGGYGDGYHPAEIVNRGQMAVFVQRAFDLPM